MNQPTKAFLKDLAALCDAHGVYFYGDVGANAGLRRRPGVSFVCQTDIATGNYIDASVADLFDLKVQLARADLTP